MLKGVPMFDISDFEPCPLCGNMPKVKIELRPDYEHFEVTCDCGISFTGTDAFDVDLWNIRPERTCVNLAIAEDKFTCSECGYPCASAIDSNGIPNNMPWISYCPNCGAKVVD